MIADQICHCGREIRLLNLASETPKCVGCGHVEENCPCDPID